MSRLQLAINVSNLETGIDFYTRMFGVQPAKVKDGYANFEITNPPLKLILFSSSDHEGGTINHLGVEVDEVAEVAEAEKRLSQSGLNTSGVEETICCFAEKTETWVQGPDNVSWEWYVKQGDTETMEMISQKCALEESALNKC
jgi:catechol 2,3-dioxygenase-like lactoylglutathione lyase family enzyme